MHNTAWFTVLFAQVVEKGQGTNDSSTKENAIMDLVNNLAFGWALKASPCKYARLFNPLSWNRYPVRMTLPLLLSFRGHQYGCRPQLLRGIVQCGHLITKRRSCRVREDVGMEVTRLIAPAALPHVSQSLSVMSYNVLLPNSIDGWWTYKMYSPALSKDNHYIASWDYRRELLKTRISLVNADVVCLQEVAPESFEIDFAFMAELGYDGAELHKKNRFRPATFWKSEKVTLAAPPMHKDRSLLTAFKVSEHGQPWFVLNCHLQAGKEGKRRVRQIHEGTKAISNLAKKLQVKDQASQLKAIVCGDFNGGSECGAVHYLETGFIDSEFLEDAEPVTSKRKDLPMMPPFQDVMTAHSRTPPPTLVVSELISQLVEAGNGYENPVLSNSVVERLTRIYRRRATDRDNTEEKQMSIDDVEQWLIDINGKLCRGDEYREAAMQMGWKAPAGTEELSVAELKKLIALPPNGVLSLEGFIAVYQAELTRGKFWGIHHDLTILGEPLEDLGLFTARFDRMYCSTSIRPDTVIDFESAIPCPNAVEPSDHLPVAASLVSVE